MSGYLLYVAISIGCTIVGSSVVGILLRKRVKHWEQRLSTEDFLPILFSTALGALIGQIIDDFVLQGMFGITNEAVSDGISHAITAVVGIGCFLWYKTRK